MSQPDDNCWEAKSQKSEKMLQGMAVLQLILYITIKGTDRCKEGYMKFVGGILWRREKAKRGHLNWRDMCFSSTGGYRIVNIYST